MTVGIDQKRNSKETLEKLISEAIHATDEPYKKSLFNILCHMLSSEDMEGPMKQIPTSLRIQLLETVKTSGQTPLKPLEDRVREHLSEKALFQHHLSQKVRRKNEIKDKLKPLSPEERKQTLADFRPFFVEFGRFLDSEAVRVASNGKIPKDQRAEIWDIAEMAYHDFNLPDVSFIIHEYLGLETVKHFSRKKHLLELRNKVLQKQTLSLHLKNASEEGERQDTSESLKQTLIQFGTFLSHPNVKFALKGAIPTKWRTELWDMAEVALQRFGLQDVTDLIHSYLTQAVVSHFTQQKRLFELGETLREMAQRKEVLIQRIGVEPEGKQQERLFKDLFHLLDVELRTFLNRQDVRSALIGHVPRDLQLKMWDLAEIAFHGLPLSSLSGNIHEYLGPDMVTYFLGESHFLEKLHRHTESGPQNGPVSTEASIKTLLSQQKRLDQMANLRASMLSDPLWFAVVLEKTTADAPHAVTLSEFMFEVLMQKANRSPHLEKPHADSTFFLYTTSNSSSPEARGGVEENEPDLRRPSCP